MKSIVVVPTYNEAGNVIPLLEVVLSISGVAEVCVVDDSSPDGTSQIVAAAIQERGWEDRVHLVTRESKGGRGGAVREGIRQGLESPMQFESFIEMDCDFSHDPLDIVEGTDLVAQGWDVVIGARYPNGTIVGWPLRRRIFSQFANTAARLALDWSIADYTNGFRFYSRHAAEALISEPQRNSGYIYLSESLVVCLIAGMKVTSFPIVFRNRERGESNTNLAEIRAGARGLIDVARWYRARRDDQA